MKQRSLTSVLSLRLCAASFQLSLALLLLACQPESPPVLKPFQAAEPLAALPAPVTYQPKAVPFAQLEALPADPQAPNQQGTGQQSLRLRIRWPEAAGGSGFRTQAFGCGEVAFAQVSVTGPGLANPIYAQGADPTHQMLAATDCEITAVLPNVPFGQRLIQIGLYNAERQLLSGSLLKAPLRLNGASQQVEISYRQLPAGMLFEALLAGSPQARFLAGQLDLGALQSFLDSLHGLGAQFPAYTFVTHPSLLNVAQLAADLQAQQGNFAALTPGASYLYSPGSLQFQLNGYLLTQDVTVSLDDALSPNALVSANGLVTLSQVPPGQWWLRLSGPGYLPTRVAVQVQAGQQTSQGQISIYPPQPSLSSLSPASGGWGTVLTLNGSHFNALPANNRLFLGATQLTVTAASTTQLTASVPNGLSVGAYPLSLIIGAASPATGQSFSVTGPLISSLSANSGSAGDSIVLTGSGFSSTPGDNSVSFGGSTGTVTAASATQLTVSVPEAIAGAVNLSVTVAGQSSAATGFTLLPRLNTLNSGQTLAGKAALVRGQTLTIVGSNFDPNPAQNTVYFGATGVLPATASATQLTVSVPSSLTLPGDLAISVASHGQTSNSITAVLPAINFEFSGGFN